jgi:hypothetical protein
MGFNDESTQKCLQMFIMFEEKSKDLNGTTQMNESSYLQYFYSKMQYHNIYNYSFEYRENASFNQTGFRMLYS